LKGNQSNLVPQYWQTGEYPIGAPQFGQLYNLSFTHAPPSSPRSWGSTHICTVSSTPYLV
ncbi:MAG: hypothetical protein IIW85_01065, partial [Bacteroidaceae bacterium]|nr:hypothetical protein [Bacteroidaceae bacterium]